MKIYANRNNNKLHFLENCKNSGLWVYCHMYGEEYTGSGYVKVLDINGNNCVLNICDTFFFRNPQYAPDIGQLCRLKFNMPISQIDIPDGEFSEILTNEELLAKFDEENEQ